MADGVAEVERAANAFFCGIFGDNAAFHLNRFLQKVEQGVAGGRRRYVVGKQAIIGILVADEAVFEHFGKARQEFFVGQRTEKCG